MSAVKIWLLAMLIPVCWSAQSALHKAHEFFQYGLYTEALKQFEKSIRSESMKLRSEALMGAARSAEQTNNNLLAERYWFEYIQQIPDSVKQDTVLWMLSKILIVNENYKEAQLYLNTYLSKHPEYRNFPKVRSLQLVISQRLHLLPQDSQSEYEVEPTNVSTTESEYAPFFHKKTGTFWFVREQKFYDFVNFQSDRSSGPQIGRAHV